VTLSLACWAAMPATLNTSPMCTLSMDAS